MNKLCWLMLGLMAGAYGYALWAIPRPFHPTTDPLPYLSDEVQRALYR
jgi:hypothetical protein